MSSVARAATTFDASGSPAAPAEAALAHLDSLPTIAPLAVRLMQLTSDPRCEVRDVVSLIQSDQALTAKLLSAAASAAVAAREPITTLDRAVVTLGLTAVRCIVLAVKVVECFARSEKCGVASLDRVEFWKHSLAVACAARRLAEVRRTLGVDPGEAYVAGLLHDLGKIALDTLFPRAYERIVAWADQTHGEIADCERSVLGVDHTVAGRILAEHWRLPRAYQEVVWLHHLAPDALPTSVASAELIALVQLADVVARERRLGYSGNYPIYEGSEVLSRRLGFTPAEIESLIESLVAEVAREAALLDLGSESIDALYRESLGRANAELGRLNTELLAQNRRLAAAERYFRALTDVDRSLSPSSDLPAVTRALVQAALTALQHPQQAVFAVRDRRSTLEICRTAGHPPRFVARSAPVTDELREWLAARHEVSERLAAPAPNALLALLENGAGAAPDDRAWLLPIVQGGETLGGIVVYASLDEAQQLTAQSDELRAFLGSLAMVIGRVNAQAAARRLSDDLADANRRLQQMRAELLRSRTLSMIAGMASGAAHELNNPLSVISGRAQMLAASAQDPEQQRALQLIAEKAHECSRIVSELMDFAQPGAPRLEPLDLPALLAEVRDAWIEQPASAAAPVRLVPPPAAPPAARDRALTIHGDRGQLAEVFGELVRNAADALDPETGRIEIAWRRTTAPPALPTANPAAPGRGAGPTDVVEVIVRDNGRGMSADVLQRAFDPFFSHLPAGRRRGLGLPRAHRLIEAHGGRIWIESREGAGTSVHVQLPLA